jgi:vesicle transport protein SEC22
MSAGGNSGVSLTFLARAQDGMMLCASLDRRGGGPYTQQVNDILLDIRRKGSHHVSAKCTVATGGNMSFHYVIDEGVCFLTLSQSSFSKRLVYGFLEELRCSFKAFVETESGPGQTYANVIAAASHPYAFIKFDQTIQRKRREYSNPGSSDNMRRLKEELTDITNIMSSNIDDILKRGENLDDLGQRSRTLKNSSKVFAKQARWMRVCKEMQQYALVGAVLLVIMFVLWWKLF